MYIFLVLKLKQYSAYIVAYIHTFRRCCLQVILALSFLPPIDTASNVSDSTFGAEHGSYDPPGTVYLPLYGATRYTMSCCCNALRTSRYTSHFVHVSV